VKKLFTRGLVATAIGLTTAGFMAALAAPAMAAPTAKSSVPLAATGSEVINRNSGKCLNVAHGSSSPGAWIQQFHCDGTGASRFLFFRNRDGYYEIQNESSARCVDVENLGQYNGARTQQYFCNGSETQQWRLDSQGNGYSKLVNRFSGRCLDVPWGSQDDWVVLNVWDCVGGAPEQEFRLN
jgi:hypothetical protein